MFRLQHPKKIGSIACWSIKPSNQSASGKKFLFCVITFFVTRQALWDMQIYNYYFWKLLFLKISILSFSDSFTLLPLDIYYVWMDCYFRWRNHLVQIMMVFYLLVSFSLLFWLVNLIENHGIFALMIFPR